MIIDPIINHLDPPNGPVVHQPHTSTSNEMSERSAGANTKSGEITICDGTSPNTEDLPPPYSEIDLERGIVEGLEETPFWARSRFLSTHESEAITNSGMQLISEGTQIFYTSIIFFAEASLLAVGTCFEGFGKILCGVGTIMKRRRSICYPIPDN